MITLFKVSDIGFIANDSDKEIFRFIPATDLNKKYDQKEILTRIFSEDVAVDEEPIPPEYTPIIQQLIDTDPQPETAADVAKILSLYNPADISNIIKSLINSSPQPTDREGILNNEVAKGYPYESHSAIYDYKYLNWTKIGTGTITREGNNYTFNNAGVQHQNIVSDIITDSIYITFEIKILDTPTSSIPIFRLYNTLSNTEHYYPFIGVNFTTLRKFTMTRRQTTDGTQETATEINDITFNIGQTPEITFAVRSNGEETYLGRYNPLPYKELRAFSTKTTIKPKNIRIMVNNSATSTTYGNSAIKIQQLKISDGYNTIYSQWNK